MKFKASKLKYLGKAAALLGLASLNACSLTGKDVPLSPTWEVTTVPTAQGAPISAKLESVEEAQLPGQDENLLELVDPQTGKFSTKATGLSIPTEAIPLPSSVMDVPSPGSEFGHDDPSSVAEAGPASEPPMPMVKPREQLSAGLMASDEDFLNAPAAFPSHPENPNAPKPLESKVTGLADDDLAFSEAPSAGLNMPIEAPPAPTNHASIPVIPITDLAKLQRPTPRPTTAAPQAKTIPPTDIVTPPLTSAPGSDVATPSESGPASTLWSKTVREAIKMAEQNQAPGSAKPETLKK